MPWFLIFRSAKVTKTTGPNGSLDWLNCGINDGGWRPPKIGVNDIIYVPLAEAVQSSSSPFKACSKYISYFVKYGKQFNVPDILLASFAMQESSCNPATVGGAGEQGKISPTYRNTVSILTSSTNSGLMQLTRDKCGSAPGGDCKEVVSTLTLLFSLYEPSLTLWSP